MSEQEEVIMKLKKAFPISEKCCLGMYLLGIREKAPRIVQGWWRERKEKYKKILDQIVKIQSGSKTRNKNRS